ncbi:MAG: hypothetical protein E6J06_08980 [Chloroflexi bacterium]|nr:MAG: hypothetical protein E6J06_08980 [Chloroflexota bacterium]
MVRLVHKQIDEIRQMAVESRDGLEPRQKATLDVGCWLILSTLAVGLQLGRWSAWSVLAAAGGYMIWVLAYSEATVQATLRQREKRAPRLAASD